MRLLKSSLMGLRQNLTNISVFLLVLLVCVMSSKPSWANDSIIMMQEFQADLKNVIEQSTDWSFQVGIGLVSLQALYVLILKLLDGGK